MSFLGSSKILSIFKRNKTNLPVPIKQGTQILDTDSNVAYEFDGDKWVLIPYHATLSAISSLSVRDEIRRINERERACKSVPYSTAKEYPVNNARRDRSDDSTNDFTTQMLMVSAAILSDDSSSKSSGSYSGSSGSYSSSCSSYDSSSSSSYSSDSGSSYDSSSSSGCD